MSWSPFTVTDRCTVPVAVLPSCSRTQGSVLRLRLGGHLQRRAVRATHRVVQHTGIEGRVHPFAPAHLQRTQPRGGHRSGGARPLTTAEDQRNGYGTQGREMIAPDGAATVSQRILPPLRTTSPPVATDTGKAVHDCQPNQRRVLSGVAIRAAGRAFHLLRRPLVNKRLGTAPRCRSSDRPRSPQLASAFMAGSTGLRWRSPVRGIPGR